MLKVDRNQSVVQPFLAQNQAQTGNYEALNDIFKGENTYIYRKYHPNEAFNS